MEIPEARKFKIKELLSKEKILSIEQICKHFDVSSITIRRDLAGLEKEGFLKKVHGGAVYNEINKKSIIDSLPIFSKQLELFQKEKDLISKEASKRIQDNCNIIIESGTTCLSMVKYLEDKKNLKVITAGFPIAIELWKLSRIKNDIKIGLCGGIINPNSSILTGVHAVNFFDYINANIAFIGCTAVSIDKGISTSFVEDSELTKVVVKSAKRVILLADSNKFVKYSFINVVPLNEIDEIITDKNIDRKIVANIEKMGIKITVV